VWQLQNALVLQAGSCVETVLKNEGNQQSSHVYSFEVFSYKNSTRFFLHAGIRVSRLTVSADRLFCKAFVIVLSSLSCVLLGCIVLAH
jgi:hypothetical protein